QLETYASRTVVRSSMVYQPHPYVRVGQMVQVEHGSLCGLTGFVTDLRSESRLRVSVSLLVRSVSVEINPAWVRPIDVKPRERFFSPAIASPVLVPFST